MGNVSFREFQGTASSETYTNAAREVQQNKRMQDLATQTSQPHEPTESQQQKQKNKHPSNLERAPLTAPLPGSFKVFFDMFSSVQVIIERLDALAQRGRHQNYTRNHVPGEYCEWRQSLFAPSSAAQSAKSFPALPQWLHM